MTTLRSALICLPILLGACIDDAETEPTWTAAYESDDGAILSVWGDGSDSVWAVGGQGNQGMVLRRDAQGWSSSLEDAPAILWWVYGFTDDDVYAVGEEGLILHFDGQSWSEIESPTTSTLYGVWGTGGEDVWLVGGDPTGQPGDAVVLRGDRHGFELVDTLPTELAPSALFKVYGGPAGLVAVGSEGTVLAYDGVSWSKEQAPTRQPIFSLWGRSHDDMYAVGGYGLGEILHYDGDSWRKHDVGTMAGGLSGVFTAPDEPTIAVGDRGLVVELDDDGSLEHPILPSLDYVPSLHGVWGDEQGTTFVVGGDLWNYPQSSRGIIFERSY